LSGMLHAVAHVTGCLFADRPQPVWCRKCRGHLNSYTL
jgi:hypothetical protein